MEKTLVLIGGGEIRSKETIEIDRKIAELAKNHAGENRAVALFIGTASHDSMPYYNSFHKTYTGEFGLKTDCVLSVYGEMNEEKINTKFEKADMIYIGGGDTVFMLEFWKEKGILNKVLDAYNRGVIISGLSAGAICWGKKMYTDSSKNGDEQYRVEDGLGILPYGICPHYDDRKVDFLENKTNDVSWLCIDNKSAVFIKNGIITETMGNITKFD